MIGNHGYEVILDAYVKGLRNFDVASAYAAMKDEVWGRGGGRRKGRRERVVREDGKGALANDQCYL